MFCSTLVICGALAACAGGDVVQVTVPPGATLRQATDSLRSAGLVKMPSLFRAFAKVTGRDRGVRAGTFAMARRSSWGTILDSLTRGRGVGLTVTIPEGLTLAAIESLLVERLSLHPDSIATATRDSVQIARYGMKARTLEGYLFPDTYTLPLGVGAQVVVKAMLDQFDRSWDQSWNARLVELEMTRHEILTLASIIEREAVIAEERPLISSVYHNRLRIGMALQADPTVQYARGQHTGRVLYEDLEIDSPYNTYKYPGLPPGPIGSPGRSSIEAALFPAESTFLYFVAHPDGHHEFRNTFAEHVAAKQRLQRIRDTNPR